MQSAAQQVESVATVVQSVNTAHPLTLETGFKFYFQFNGNIHQPEFWHLKTFIDLTYGSGKSKLLDISDGLKVIENEELKSTWEKMYFYQVPLDYIYRNLDQLILDIKMTEGTCIK